MSNFLEIRNISKSYGKHLALDDVSLNIPRGCVYGLLGPNGAGKSTLIRIISLITLADKGDVLLEGRPIRQKDIFKIGYLPEERGLYKKMVVFDQLLYFATLRGLEKRVAIRVIEEWLEKFDLQKWRNKKIEVLSKGMAQKVQFIATIVHSPSLLILDEPFSGFDPVNSNILKDEILRLKNQGVTILLSTHNMSSVEEICSDISIIHNAKNIASGSVQEIRRKYAQNIYEVQCCGDISSLKTLQDLKLEIRESSPTQTHTIRLQSKSPELSTRQLIELLNNNVTIESFRKVVPSMNDIFLILVS